MYNNKGLTKEFKSALLKGRLDTSGPFGLRVQLGKIALATNRSWYAVEVKISIVDKYDNDMSILFDDLVSEDSSVTFDDVRKSFNVQIS